MTGRDIPGRSRSALLSPAWVELAGGAILVAIIAGFLSIVLTSIHW